MPSSRSQMFDAPAAAGISRSGPEIPGAPPVGRHPADAPVRPRQRGQPRWNRIAPPPHTCTFARIVGFDLSCPNCGTVDCVRSASGLPWWKGTTHFDSWRSRWQCRACRRVYVVGLALWPARRAGNRPRPDGRPIDTIPDRAQVMQLREVHGLVRTQSRGWHEPVNLICTCDRGDDEHRLDCPLSEDEPE